MLVQRREGSLRLITQHDHALGSGEMAARWTGRSGRDASSFALVAAVGLHDVAWRPLDRAPVLDPGTGAPYAFDEHPLEPKLSAYRSGLDTMEACDPWIGLLGSLHYASFLDDDRAPAFLREEKGRRSKLRDRLERGGRPVDEERLRDHLAILQLLDRLSLVACLTGPGVAPGAERSWLRGPFRGPGDEVYDGRWQGPERLAVEPFPFREPFDLEIPFRAIPAGPYGSRDALSAAWGEGEAGELRIRVQPG